MAPKHRRSCPECGSRRFRKNDDGSIACKNGHVQPAWQEEVSEDAFRRPGANLRAQRKRQREDEKDESYLKGQNSAAAAVLPVQFAYRALIRGIRKKFQLSESFELMSRELWLLYIGATERILPEKFDTRERSAPQRRLSTDVDEFLQNAEKENVSDNEPDNKEERNDDDGETTKWPTLRYYHSIVLCYLACIRYKLPIFLCDIHRWVLSSELPYLDIQAIIPAELIVRLHHDLVYSFANPGQMWKLYAMVDRYSRCFSYHCGVSFEGNEELALIRCCGQLFCSVEEYLAARNIRHVLAAKNFPKKSVVEIRAMICALWAVRKDWLEYRKKKNRLFQKLEEAENPTKLWYPNNVKRYQLLKGNLEHWRKIDLALKPKIVQEAESDRAPELFEFLEPGISKDRHESIKRPKQGYNKRMEAFMRDVTANFRDNSELRLKPRRVQPQDIIVPWDRPNLNMANDEAVADKWSPPTKEADVTLFSVATEYLKVDEWILRTPLSDLLSAHFAAAEKRDAEMEIV